MSKQTIIRRLPQKLIIRDFNNDTNIARHLSKDFVTECLVLQNVPKLVKGLYNNDAMPCQKCVRYVNDGFLIHIDGQWSHSTSTTKVLQEIIETSYRILRNHFNNNPDLVYDYYTHNGMQPDLYKLETWLEDLWDNVLDDIKEIRQQIIACLQ